MALVQIPAPSAGAKNWILLNSGGTALSGSNQVSVTGINAKEILVFILNSTSATAGTTFAFRVNDDSGTNYAQFSTEFRGASTYTPDIFGRFASYFGSSEITFGKNSSVASNSFVGGAFYIDKANESGSKRFTFNGYANIGSTANDNRAYIGQGIYSSSLPITSINYRTTNSTNMNGGTMYVFGAN
jgi:hypothetical protein